MSARPVYVWFITQLEESSASDLMADESPSALPLSASTVTEVCGESTALGKKDIKEMPVHLK